MKTLVSKRILDYILIAFIVLWSGGLATYGTLSLWPYLLGVLLLAYFIVHDIKIGFTTGHLMVFGAAALVLSFQVVRFESELGSIAAPLATLFTCSLIARFIEKPFWKIFPEIVFWFALISLPFWFVDVFPPGHSLLLSVAEFVPQFGTEALWDVIEEQYQAIYSLYFYGVATGVNPDAFVFDFIPRNPGPFWEPGRFTIYLALALLINLFNNPEKILTRKNAVLLAADITTFSTTGYVALAIILIGTVTLRNQVKVKDAILVIVMSAGVIAVSQLDFMSVKVATQMADLGNENTRFGAFLYHLTQIAQSPFFGFGNELNEFFGEAVTSPCGVSDLARFWGVPMALFFYFLLYKGTACYILKRKGQWQFVLSFFILMVLAFSQTITMSPFYFSLYFMAFSKPLADRSRYTIKVKRK